MLPAGTAGEHGVDFVLGRMRVRGGMKYLRYSEITNMDSHLKDNTDPHTWTYLRAHTSPKSFSRTRTKIAFTAYLQDPAFKAQVLQQTLNMSGESCFASNSCKRS